MNKDQALEKYKKQISENDRLGLGTEALNRLDDPFNKRWIGGLVSESYKLESQLSLATQIIEKLEKAVEFYGNYASWHRSLEVHDYIDTVPSSDCSEIDKTFNEPGFIGGKLARATLSEIQELKKKMKEGV